MKTEKWTLKHRRENIKQWMTLNKQKNYKTTASENRRTKVFLVWCLCFTGHQTVVKLVGSQHLYEVVCLTVQWLACWTINCKRLSSNPCKGRNLQDFGSTCTPYSTLLQRVHWEYTDHGKIRQEAKKNEVTNTSYSLAAFKWLLFFTLSNTTEIACRDL